MTPIHYRRILLKISGEMLAGSQAYGIQPDILTNLAQEVGEVVRMDVEVWSLEAATFFEALQRVHLEWSVPRLTIWEC